MAKMRKEYDPNKVARRKRIPIIYIICEGKETETLYFKHFRSRNCLVDIIPISSKHKAAEHLVKHAKSLISQADYYPKDGDQLWCVFDCDDNKDLELRAATEYADKHGYQIAYSNPSFEYWYLIHFEKRNGYLKDCDAVINVQKAKVIWKTMKRALMFLMNCFQTRLKQSIGQKSAWNNYLQIRPM